MAKYKPSKGDLRNLLRILKVEEYKTRRTELRAATLVVLKRTLTEAEVDELCDSGVIPAGTKVSHSGLRDVLSMRAMANICRHGGKGIEWATKAITRPVSFGVDSTRSSSGYEVGTHREMDTIGGIEKELEAMDLVEATGASVAGEIIDAVIDEKEQEKLEDVVGRVRRMSTTGARSVLGAAVKLHEEEGGDPTTVAELIEAIKLSVSEEFRDEKLSSWWIEEVASKARTSRLERLTEQTLMAARDRLKKGEPIVPVEGESLPKSKLSILLARWMAKRTTKESEEGSESMTTKAKATAVYEIKDEDKRQLVDLSLKSAGLPGITELLDQVKKATGLEAAKAELETEVSKLRSEVAMAPVAAPAVIEATGTGEMPKGEVVIRNAAEVFGISGKEKAAFDFNVPSFEWDGDHPHVEPVDEGYVIRNDLLLPVLLSLINNEPTWIWGHTGTGKTTGLLQILARLKWPNYRVNLDGDMTRMDMMGKDVIRQEGGASISEFQEGVFPRYLKEPYVLILDEFDAIRETVSYAVQRVLENDGLILTEDGGRLVKPHQMSRLFATANTVGQGDEDGLYPAVRPQSSATLDRFVRFIKVDYLNKDQRHVLIEQAGKGLNADEVEKIGNYVTEHIQAFSESNSIMLPISPRGFCAMAKVAGQMAALSKTPKQRSQAMKMAVEYTILNRATPQDLSVLNGIVDRVF